MKLKKLTPILWTKNLQETIAFYVDLLNFACRFHDERFAALAKDDIEIMTIIPVDDSDSCKVSENEEEFFPKSYFTGSSIYIDTENVDELWEQIKDKVNVK